MQVRRDPRTDERELFHRGTGIGWIRGGAVIFTGFTTRGDAELAGSIAHSALRRRRARDPQLVPTHYPLTVPTVALQDMPDGSESWTVRVDLAGDERHGVFAMSRARSMWSALRASGLDRRMGQLAAEQVAGA